MKKIVCRSMDSIMYAMMNYLQWQLRHETTSQATLEAYLNEYASWNRADYFASTAMKNIQATPDFFSWDSPMTTSFAENNRARALFFPAAKKNNNATKQPTLIILHALMSASDRGYRQIAARMNAQGWNVLFPHLPFHYSRTPRHHANGALAITTDLVHTAETVRQAVQEIRQLMTWSRAQGSTTIGLLATSYGGWIASLLLTLEPIDFAILLQPIIQLQFAAFESPLASVMGTLLQARGITAAHFERHAHLTGSTFAKPRTDPKRIAIIGSRYDQIIPPHLLRPFATGWNAHYEEAAQGHFGYEAMKQALVLMDRFSKRVS